MGYAALLAQEVSRTIKHYTIRGQSIKIAKKNVSLTSSHSYTSEKLRMMINTQRTAAHGVCLNLLIILDYFSDLPWFSSFCQDVNKGDHVTFLLPVMKKSLVHSLVGRFSWQACSVTGICVCFLSDQ